jgi:hypothetical protein
MTIGKKTGGRQSGTPNKATVEARQAIAQFVEGNSHRLTEWLDKVAAGDEQHDIKPNPGKAFELFQSMVEYHVPKLGRMEHTGSDDKPLVVEHNLNVFGELLKNMKMQRQSE